MEKKDQHYPKKKGLSKAKPNRRRETRKLQEKF